MVLFTKEYFPISFLCLLLLIFRSWSTLLRYCGRSNLPPIAFHAVSPEYALKRAHMRDNFLRDARISQFGLFVWYANLTAFFCTLSNEFICPSLYGFIRFLRDIVVENQGKLCRKSQFELELLLMISESASTSSEHKFQTTINFKKWNDSRRGVGISCAMRGGGGGVNYRMG